MSKKNSKKPLIIIALLLYLIGGAVLFYPIWSQWWNEHNQSQAIQTYQGDVEKASREEVNKVWKNAQLYNQKLYKKGLDYYASKGNFDHYKKQLLVGDSNVMGIIDIPSINVHLPIYHGTEDRILEVGVGHLEGTSLPTGGKNTHAVLTGHTGLPSGGTLFTPLVKLRKGNLFSIRVLNKVLYYQVDDIKVEKPEKVHTLRIYPGKDYVTLITCTPYGVNSHRLLVRGVRINEDLSTPNNIRRIPPIIVWLVFAAIVIALLILYFVLRKKRQKKINEKERQESIEDETKER